MGKYYKASKIPMIDYGMDFPFQELTNAARYKQQRYDQTMENANAIKNNFNILVDPEKDLGTLNKLQEQTDVAINEIFDRYGGDLSAPGVQQDINNLAQEVGANKFLTYAPEYYKIIQEQKKQAAALRAQGAREEDIMIDDYYADWEGTLLPNGQINPWMLQTPGFQYINPRPALESMVDNYKGTEDLVYNPQTGETTVAGRYITREELGQLVGEHTGMYDFKQKPEYQTYLRTAERMMQLNPDAHQGKTIEMVADELLAEELNKVLNERVYGDYQGSSSSSSGGNKPKVPAGVTPGMESDIKDENYSSFDNVTDARRATYDNYSEYNAILNDPVKEQEVFNSIMRNQTYVDLQTDNFMDWLADGGNPIDGREIDLSERSPVEMRNIAGTLPQYNNIRGLDFAGNQTLKNYVEQIFLNPNVALSEAYSGQDSMVTAESLNMTLKGFADKSESEKQAIVAQANNYLQNYREWFANGGEDYMMAIDDYAKKSPINNRIMSYHLDNTTNNDMNKRLNTGFNASQIFDVTNAKRYGSSDAPTESDFTLMDQEGFHVMGIVDGGAQQGIQFLIRPNRSSTEGKDNSPRVYRMRLNENVRPEVVDLIEQYYNVGGKLNNYMNQVDIQTMNNYYKNTGGDIYSGMNIKTAINRGDMVAGVEPLLRIYGNAEDGRGMRGQEYGIQFQIPNDPVAAGMLGLEDRDGFSLMTADGQLTNYGYAMMYRDVAESMNALEYLPENDINQRLQNPNAVARFATPEATFVFYEDIANAYLNLKIAQNYR